MSTEMGRIERIQGKMAFNTNTRLEFYQQLASFLEGGVPLHGVLEKLAENHLRTNKKNPELIVLRDIMKEMAAGRSFADALSNWAPGGEIMLIQSGEKSGNPAEALRNAVTTTQASKSMVTTLISGLAYPAVLLIVLMVLIYIFSVFAVPTLVEVKDPSDWPTIAKPLYGMSQFVENFWWAVLLFIVGSTVWVVRALPTMKGTVRQRLDKFPPFSFYKTFQSSVMLISVSSLMQSGVPLVDSLESLALRSRGYVAQHLRTILIRLRAGKAVGDAFDTGFLSEVTVRNIRIYSELSTLHASMDRIGRDAVAGGMKTIQALSAALNVLIIMSITGYVGWVYYSFFSLMQTIGADSGGF